MINFLLSEVNTGAIPHVQQNQFWLFLILTAMLVFLVVLRANFRREMDEMARALTNRNLAMQMYRNREFALSPPSLLLFVLFVFNLGMFLYLAMGELGIQIPGLDYPSDLLMLFLLIMLIYWVRDASRRLAGLLFGFEERINFYNYQISLLNTLCGLFLAPVLFVLAFADSPIALVTVYISLGLLVCLYLWRLVQGLLLGSSFVSHSPFHFILYICTLEIAPVLIFYRVAIIWLSAT